MVLKNGYMLNEHQSKQSIRAPRFVMMNNNKQIHCVTLLDQTCDSVQPSTQLSLRTSASGS